MSMDFLSAMPSMPALPIDGQSAPGNSLFQVIQGNESSEAMQKLEGVFAEVLGYTQEQMAEMQEILSAQGEDASPMEQLEDWMTGLQELFTELGVQLEKEGFQLNAKAFAQNLIQVNGEELGSLKDLQNALMAASDGAEVPAFIHTQFAMTLEVTQKNPSQSDDTQELSIDNTDLDSSSFAFKALMSELSPSEGMDEFKALRMNLRQLVFQQENPNASTLENAETVQNAFATIQGLMKTLMAKLEMVEKTITDEGENWAMEAAENGFQASEIQLIAQFKNLLGRENKEGEQAESENESAWFQLNSQMASYSSEDSAQSAVEIPLILPQDGVQQPHMESDSTKVVSIKDLKVDADQAQSKQEQASQAKGELDPRLEKPDTNEDSQEKRQDQKNEAQAKLGILPKATSGAELNSLPDEQTFTNIKTDAKGNLILEKITQTQSSGSSNAPKHPVVRQIENQVSVMFEKGESRTTLTLNPDNLGRVEMEVRIHQDKMQLMISVENDKVKSILESNLNQLKDHLSQHNLHLDKSEVNIDYRQAGQQGKQDAHHKGFGRRGQDETLIVEMEAHEGDETGRRLGYNTMEYLA